MSRALAFLLLVSSLVVHAVTPGPAPSPGGLDASFGRGGVEYTNLGAAIAGMTGITGMALQADGKIVVVGLGLLQFGTAPLLARFNPDGSLDVSFNSIGYATANPAGMTSVSALAIQPDGKIVVVGSGGAGANFAVARFNANGAVDTSFGGTGGLLTGGTGAAAAVAIQADGRIVVAGYALVRYDADGTLDTSFGGGDGVAAPSFGANALALQPDGKIVVGGSASGDFAVARYNTDGTLDTTFNGTGSSITSLSPNNDFVRSLAIAPDGKIVAAGLDGGPLCCLDGPGFGIARYNTDGTLDTTFNGTGHVYRSFGRLSASASSVVVLPDGRIVVAGSHFSDTYTEFAVTRLTAAGAFDGSFNFTPRALYGAFGSERLNAMALQPDGKVVVAGVSGPTAEYVLLRVNVAGSSDATFGRAGYASMPSALRTDAAYAVGIQSDGKIVAAGSTDDLNSSDPVTFARYGTDGRQDRVYGSGRASYTANSNLLSSAHAYGLAMLADNRMVIAGDVVTTGINTGSFPTSNFLVARVGTSGFVEASAQTTLENFSTAKALRIQGDGKIVVAGFTGTNTSFQPLGTKHVALVRYNADLSLDTGFNGTGIVVTVLGSGDAQANAVAIRADGTIIAAGAARNASNQDWAFVLYSAAGAPTGSILLDVSGGSDDAIHAMAIQPDGAILVAGSAGIVGGQAALARFTSPGLYDASFADAGIFKVNGVHFVSLALQADGKILALTADFHVWRFTTSGQPDPTFGVGGRVALAMSGAYIASAIAVQANGRIVVTGTADGGFGQDFFVARIDPAAPLGLVPSTSSLDFGGQSINTTSASATLTFTNPGPGPLTVTSAAGLGGFRVVGNTCGTLAGAGSTCQVSVTFTPTVQGPIRGTLLLRHDPSREAIAVTLVGQGERSLVTHYYGSILRRDPDAGGKAFWDSEATRVSTLGANVNETWFALAQAFYTSAEYQAFNRDNTGFTTDLYNTFFNRAPDSGGLAYWKGQLDSGLPREVLLAQFMFSPEFAAFAQAIFGTPTTRAEVNAVTDFYRGLLARLPDSDGFNFWVGRFRAAQCQGQAAITNEVEAISSAFALSGEYAARGRTSAQYVGDLYNAFLRRGGDLPGVQNWIGQVDSGAMTREQVRVEFRNSAEFQQRVNAIIQQGCVS